MRGRPVVTILAALLVILLAPGAFAAGGGAGTTSATFLNMPVGARSAALGNTYAAADLGLEGGYMNPASLARLDEAEVLLMHHNYIESIDFNFLGYAQPVGRQGTLGVSLLLSDYGNIPRRGINTATLQPVNLGTFSADDLLLTLGYARRFGRNLDIGVNGRFLQETIDDVTAEAISFDLGSRFRPGIPNLELGFTIRNLGQGPKFISVREDLPLAYRWGASYQIIPDRLGMNLDYQYYDEGGDEFAFGIEGRVVNNLVLRGGYNSAQDIDDGFSLGAGFTIGNFTLDYAFTPFGSFGDAHRFAATVLFPSNARDTQPPPAPVIEVRGPEIPSPDTAEAAPIDETVEMGIANVDTEASLAALSEGQALYDEGDDEGALEAFHRAAILDPGNIEALFNLATMRYKLEDYSGAASAYKGVISLAPTDEESYLYLGFSLYQTGDYEGALSAWREVLAINPGNEIAAENARAIEEALGSES